MSEPGNDHDWQNPMRFSIGHKDVDVTEFGVDVTEIEIRPSEGNIYVHWDEAEQAGDRDE